MSNKAGRAWEAVELERAVAKGQKRSGYVPKTNRLLIALAYWERDRGQAQRLARFLADLEPKHTDLADFLFTYRYDCAAPDPDTVSYVSRKFNTFVNKSPHCATGWPLGCNSLWSASMNWVARNIEANRVPHYKAIFVCEADGGPCVQDWIAQMSREWDRVDNARPTYVAGPLVQLPAEHINGNCLLSCDPTFLRWVTKIATALPRGGGWDFVLARHFRKWGWANIPRMRSYYNSPSFSVNQYMQMRREEIIWMHGGKDDSLMNHGRTWLLGGKDGLK